MAGVTKRREPPPGYPSGGVAAEEEQVPQVVDEAQQDGEDDEATDRGISAGFTNGRSKPRVYQGGYPAPVLYNPSLYDSSQGGYPGPVIYNPSRYDNSPQQTHGRHGYQPHLYGDDYDGGYQNRLPAYMNNRPQQMYGQPPPPFPRGRYYYRNDYGH